MGWHTWLSQSGSCVWHGTVPSALQFQSMIQSTCQPLQTPRFRANPLLSLLIGLLCLKCTAGHVCRGTLAFFKTFCRCAALVTHSGHLGTVLPHAGAEWCHGDVSHESHAVLCGELWPAWLSLCHRLVFVHRDLPHYVIQDMCLSCWMHDTCLERKRNTGRTSRGFLVS